MKELKDYLHLYLGCQVDWKKFPDNESYSRNHRDLGTLACISIYGDVVVETKDSQFHRKLKDVKLILRPLSDMTEEEAREFCIKEGWGENLSNIIVTDSAIEFMVNVHTQAVSRFTRCRPEMFLWLLSKGFDLFNLIPEGLAIDSTTLKEKV